LALATIRIRTGPWDGTAEGIKRTEREEDAPPAGKQPKVEVDRAVYEFEEMDSQAKGTHPFTLKNVGNDSLTLKKGGTTCKCTLSELERTELAPGESTTVTLTWTPKNLVGEFRQTATILTNDPTKPRVELVVKGKVVTTLRTSPDEVVFTKVPAGETATATVHLFCTRPKAAKILGYELADPRTAEQFGVVFKPMPPDHVAGEAGARSGYLVQITVKPGLSPGPFRQTIRIKTDVTPIEISVRGTVATGMSIAGRGWNDELGLLAIGSFSSREGFERTYRIVVGGPYRKEVRITGVKAEPDLLHVTLGQPVDKGATVETPITIRIPRGSPPANFLGSERAKLGVIALETSHPHVPTWKIPVQFAIEN
jgi:hypothetical protein